MSQRPFSVLFLCTANSARSIIAEAIMNAIGGERFKAFSAGSHPGGEVNPLVVAYLKEQDVPTAGARSKSWDEFARIGAPEVNLVVTVCDQAAGEACPVWPGHPATAHWGVEDPARHMHDPAKARKAVEETFQTLHTKIQRLMALPIEKLDRPALQRKAREIGEQT